VLLCIINAVPLLAVALISQMGSFTDVLGFLGAWRAASSWSFSAVAGLAAPIISGLMGYLLPIFMRRIAKYRGVTTRSKLDRVIVSQVSVARVLRVRSAAAHALGSTSPSSSFRSSSSSRSSASPSR
jgi:hypothetical protein